jgi:hypothetical protein
LAKGITEKIRILNKWFVKGGILFIGYDMFRELCDNTNQSRTQEEQDEIEKLLLVPGPSLVLCDEGHALKNIEVNNL